MRGISLFLLFFISLTLNGQDGSPLAKKGILDLSGIKDQEHFIYNLNGEWEFYWRKMLHPHDFLKTNIFPDHYGRVPSYWTDYPERIGTESNGYATYRLRVVLPAGFRDPLAIDLPVFDSSYDIYIDGRYLASNGITGKTAEETTPEYKRIFSRIQPSSDTIDIVINVSNFHHRRGGFWRTAKLGTFEEARNMLANGWAAEWAVISLLLGFSVLFLFFYIFSPKEKITIFYSLLAFGLAIRPLFTSHFLITNFFDISWTWLVRCEYLGLSFIIISLAWFSFNLYPGMFSRMLAYTVSILFSIVFLVVLFTPVSIFSHSMMLVIPVVLIEVLFVFYKSLLGALKKDRIEISYMFIFSLIFAGSIHDILVSLGRASSGIGYSLTYLVVIVMFIQAMLLLYKWIKAFKEKEKLQIEMEFMNRNLEKLIDERTQELKRRNEEIGLQNARIAQQNRELSETIQLKNRIFSVVAHDLRSPVVNILYMLNLLKEKEFKEKYDTFANSCIDYAQRVISLLENMLVWGRGQEEKIKFSPENHDLADIILTNLSIFKETADKKEISVNFTQVGSPIAFCDRDLLDIIIRNILSNAVKYTPRKGRISIFLKDKKNNGEGIMLKISDNGCGMDEEKQKRIFTSEEIESTPGTENEKGTGLGLKLCHELVKINNGNITVESKLNEGTSFVITLPA